MQAFGFVACSLHECAVQWTMEELSRKGGLRRRTHPVGVVADFQVEALLRLDLELLEEAEEHELAPGVRGAPPHRQQGWGTTGKGVMKEVA